MAPEKLIELAKEAMTHAYAPYSHFKVGAALLCADGTVYQGCNIENASYSPTNCAERTAFFKAVSEGERQFSAIAIVAAPEGAALRKTAPCGVCRQVMMEFSPEMEVICLNGAGESKTFALRELLPYGFDHTWL